MTRNLQPLAVGRPSAIVEDLRGWLADEPPPEGADYSQFVDVFDLSGMLWDVLQLWGMKGI